MTRLLGKSRDYYYKILTRRSENKITETLVLEMVNRERLILLEEGGKKLYYRLKEEIELAGIKMGRDKFLKLLRENGLLKKKKKYKQPVTDSNHPYRKHKNLIKELEVERPDQVWVSDITYIRVGEDWIYLTLIMDLYSRKIMGYNLSLGMKVDETTRPSMKMALKNKKSKGATIFHSDRGFQYCNPKFVEENSKKRIIPSMTNNGDPYENAAAERLNGILKYEFHLRNEFKSFEIAKEAVKRSINLYNSYRTHYGINLKTPNYVYANAELFKMNNVNCNY